MLATAPVSISEPASVVVGARKRRNATSGPFRYLAIHMHEPARQRARDASLCTCATGTKESGSTVAELAAWMMKDAGMPPISCPLVRSRTRWRGFRTSAGVAPSIRCSVQPSSVHIALNMDLYYREVYGLPIPADRDLTKATSPVARPIKLVSDGSK